MTSYQLSERFDVQTILSTAFCSLWSLLRTLLLLLVAGAALAGVFALVVAFWLPVAQFIGGLAIIAVFAYVTYPRKAVRNG